MAKPFIQMSQTRCALLSLSLILCLSLAALGAVAADKPDAPPSLKQALADLKVPPAWVETTPITWDTNKPWKDARLEIRRLLGLGTEPEVRQAVKLTWMYSQKGDIGNGHELPMYLFMSGNYAWATLEYPKHIKTVEGKGATHEYVCYAACLAHFGEYAQAIEVLETALKDLPPKPWQINSMANIQNQMGDVCVKMGDAEKARKAYAEAIRLYPLLEQPNAKPLITRRVAMVQAKLDMMSLAALSTAKLRDGVYKANALGYADAKEMTITVTIRGGKMADIKVTHQEKIDLGATTIIPQRIVTVQSLTVDAVTGATVTSQGIIDGTFRALKQAGLE
ncbi:MAG: FMN-binding protein [Tepidisphaerales bacterium]